MHPNKSALSAILLALASSSAFAQYTLDPLWNLNPGSRSYITSGDAQRGIAYNAATDHLLIVNRSGALSVNVISGATGANVGTLSVAGITGGTLALNLIRVADDGAIYAVNQTTDSAGVTTPLKIYRWANESATPTVAYTGDPSAGDAVANNRNFGNTFDVRGSGATTQMVLGSRNGVTATVISTANGTTFTSTKITAVTAAGDMGLGLAFTDPTSNNFWAKSSGRTLKALTFDLATGMAGVAVSYPTTTVPSTVSAIDSFGPLLVGINLNASPTPDTSILYETSAGVTLQDTESFAADNANGNATGSIDYGGGRVYVLDSNNGIAAYTLGVPEPGTLAMGGLGLLALVAHAVRRRK